MALILTFVASGSVPKLEVVLYVFHRKACLCSSLPLLVTFNDTCTIPRVYGPQPLLLYRNLC